MKPKNLFASLCVPLLLLPALSGCGDETESEPLVVAWEFPEGDCASNEVETVRVTRSQDDETVQEEEFACADGSGNLGQIDEGSHGILAEGLDADGEVVAANYGTTITVGPAGAFGGVDVTLHPKAANVLVSWNVQGSGNCPPGVVMPFFIAVYHPPADGSTEEFGEKVTEVQESCQSGQATVQNVAPGDYIVEVDSRAVAPAVRGTEPVTVEPGADAEVSVDM